MKEQNNAPVYYKILTPEIIHRTKDDKTLAILAILLPGTEKPMNKRKCDVAIPVQYMKENKSDLDALGKSLRQTFTEIARTQYNSFTKTIQR